MQSTRATVSRRTTVGDAAEGLVTLMEVYLPYGRRALCAMRVGAASPWLR